MKALAILYTTATLAEGHKSANVCRNTT